MIKIIVCIFSFLLSFSFLLTDVNAQTPTATSTPESTATSTPGSTATPTSTATSTPTSTVTATPTSTATATVTPTPSATTTPISNTTPTPSDDDSDDETDIGTILGDLDALNEELKASFKETASRPIRTLIGQINNSINLIEDGLTEDTPNACVTKFSNVVKVLTKGINQFQAKVCKRAVTKSCVSKSLFDIYSPSLKKLLDDLKSQISIDNNGDEITDICNEEEE
jgi:hypothetical protein